MLIEQTYLDNYNPIHNLLQLLSSEKDLFSDSISSLVDDFISQLDFNLFPSFAHWPNLRYPASTLLCVWLLGMAHHGYCSSRKLADLCAHDLRYLKYFTLSTPSHQTLFNFQRECLLPAQEEIFRQLNLYIESKDHFLNKETLFLDGTKLEANANKYTFVWSAATAKFKASAWRQLIGLIEKINRWLITHHDTRRISTLAKPTPDWLFQVENLLVTLEKEYHIQIVGGKGKRKHPLQRFHDQFCDLGVKLFKYFYYEDLADGRNSFSKTDPDATFMHMKYDYYNHTNVFKPGYNIQLGSSSGYIRVIYVSQKCNDILDFIPTLEKYADQYGEYPERVPADAGYGSYDNYSYCKENGIQLMMKYSGQEKEKKITETNKFRSYAFPRTEEGVPICPAGHIMELEKTTLSTTGLYPREISLYGTGHCASCPLRKKCTQSKKGRKVQVCHQQEEFKKEVRENMSTEEGQSIMVSRSIQAEGVFGDLKNNFKYDRIKRKGLNNVKFEMEMVACGHNLRKLASRMAMKREEIENYGKKIFPVS